MDLWLIILIVGGVVFLIGALMYPLFSKIFRKWGGTDYYVAKNLRILGVITMLIGLLWLVKDLIL